MGKKKLPAPAQPGDGSPEGDAIATLSKLIASGGTFVPCDDIEVYRAERYRDDDAGAVIVSRVINGEYAIKWRSPGKSGADFDIPPRAVKNARLEQRYIVEINKVLRALAAIERNRNRKGFVHSSKEADVLRLAAEHPDKGCNLSAFIAQKLGLTQRTVQRILKKRDNTKKP